jgi:hypothetical protein
MSKRVGMAAPASFARIRGFGLSSDSLEVLGCCANKPAEQTKVNPTSKAQDISNRMPVS